MFVHVPPGWPVLKDFRAMITTTSKARGQKGCRGALSKHDDADGMDDKNHIPEGLTSTQGLAFPELFL